MSQKTQSAEKWIRDVETIKVFAHPLRLKIIKLMEEPTTVKEISARLELPPAKLYYHVNLLEKHGLIQVVDHNLETGIVEKIYQVTAREFKLVNPLVAGDEFPAEAADALFTEMLQNATHGLQQALANRDPEEPSPPRHPFMTQKTFRLTDEQLTKLHGRLDGLIREVTAIQAENEEGDAPIFELTLAFYKK